MSKKKSVNTIITCSRLSQNTHTIPPTLFTITWILITTVTISLGPLFWYWISTETLNVFIHLCPHAVNKKKSRLLNWYLSVTLPSHTDRAQHKVVRCAPWMKRRAEERLKITKKRDERRGRRKEEEKRVKVKLLKIAWDAARWERCNTMLGV